MCECPGEADTSRGLTYTNGGDLVQMEQWYKSPGGLIVATIEIPLNKGFVTRIYEADRVFTDGHTWHVKAFPHGNTLYAATGIGGKTVLLHSLLAPDWEIVDHADRNGLNNCRHNLRDGTEFRNQANKGIQRNNTSGFKGVARNHGRWTAYISIDGQRIYLGNFGTPEEAADAYDEAAVRYFGEYALTNAMLGLGTGPRIPVPRKQPGRICPPDCTCGRHAPRVITLDQFCGAGHEYTPENTYIKPGSGHRECRTCISDRKLRGRSPNPPARGGFCPPGCTCGRHRRRAA
jgi:AP2 domain